jgi:hypothetical protein
MIFSCPTGMALSLVQDTYVAFSLPPPRYPHPGKKSPQPPPHTHRHLQQTTLQISFRNELSTPRPYTRTVSTRSRYSAATITQTNHHRSNSIRASTSPSSRSWTARSSRTSCQCSPTGPATAASRPSLSRSAGPFYSLSAFFVIIYLFVLFFIVRWPRLVIVNSHNHPRARRSKVPALSPTLPAKPPPPPPPDCSCCVYVFGVGAWACVCVYVCARATCVLHVVVVPISSHK